MTEISAPGSLGWLQAVGIMGFLIYIGAFTAVQLAWMNGNGVAFSLTNTIAAMLVATSLVADFNLASALIQGSWIVIGTAGIVTRSVRARSAKMGPYRVAKRPQNTLHRRLSDARRGLVVARAKRPGSALSERKRAWDRPGSQ